MADRYLLESGSPDGYLLEDGSGVLLLDTPATVGWHATDASGDFNISQYLTVTAPANLVVTGTTGVGSTEGVRASSPAPSGKFQYEVTLTTMPGGGSDNVCVGIDGASVSLTALGLPSDSYTYVSGGGVFERGAFAQAASTAVAGQIVTVAGDTVNGTLKLFLDGVQQGTTTTGISLASWWAYAGTAQADVFTANFTGPFAYQQTGYSAYDPGTGGTVVAPAKGHLAFTGYQPAITLSTVIAPATAHLTFGGKVSSVSIGTVVAPSTGHLAFTGKQSSVTLNVGVSPSAGHLTFGGKVPTVTRTTAVSAAVGHLAFTGKTPTVVLGVNVFPSVGHLSLGGKVSTVALTLRVSPSAGHLAFGGKVPTVSVSSGLLPSTGHLAFTGKVPTLTTTLNPATGHLSFAGHVPALGLAISSNTGHIVFAGHVPLFAGTITPLTGHIAFSGHTPTVSYGPGAIGHIKVDLGGFVARPVKVWNGSAWIVKPLKFWTGTVWRATGY